MPSTRRILGAAAVAMCFGLAAIALLDGFSDNALLRLLEGVAVFVAGAALLGAVVSWVALRMADWKEPESEEEFELLVLESERLAREGTAAEPDEGDFLSLDPYDDGDFAELVREALD